MLSWRKLILEAALKGKVKIYPFTSINACNLIHEQWLNVKNVKYINNQVTNDTYDVFH